MLKMCILLEMGRMVREEEETLVRNRNWMEQIHRTWVAHGALQALVPAET